jgi:CheY-like chemotaxis protein
VIYGTAIPKERPDESRTERRGRLQPPIASDWPGRDSGGASRRPCVLVVDDDPHDREIYGRILCYNGFDVVFAGTGEDALRAVDQHGIDLMILDLGLPDIPGLVALERIRSKPRHSSLPVIALSGFAYEQMAERARRAGCWRYLEKPASPVAVMHAVEDIVGRPPLSGVGQPPTITDRTEEEGGSTDQTPQSG